MNSVAIQNAYIKCEEVIQSGSKTFYKAFSLLPKADRQAVYAIYTFCRFLDDTVDESDTPKESLMVFLNEFKRFRNGEVLNKPLWIALADVFERYEMDETPFLELAEGMRWDIEKNRYQTLEETEQYSYYVASTVGLMLLPILAPQQPDLRKSAIDLGIAMQLTNILRDVGEDAKRGRIYLPHSWMETYGVTAESLLAGCPSGDFIGLWEEVALRAEHLYDAAIPSFDRYPRESRRALKAAAFLYRGILDAARDNHYDVFTKRAYVSRWQKMKLLATI